MKIFVDEKEITNVSEFEVNYFNTKGVVTYTFKIEVEGNSELCKSLYKIWRNQNVR